MNDAKTLSQGQLAVLIFVVTFTFKMSRLPPLVAERVGSSGFFLISLYLIPELILFFIVYRFIKTGGLDALEEEKNKIVYKILMATLAVYFFMKLCLTYSGSVLFVKELLFENISPIEITFTLIVPTAYFAYKGITAIAKTAQICIWYVVFVLALNLIFLKAIPDFTRNLPLFNDSAPAYFAKGSRFFFWFGDFAPFVFLTVKGGKRASVYVSVAASFALVVFGFALMSALYGNSAQYVTNFIVKVASFNQFASKLGRLDWTGMIAWLLLSMIYLGIYLWAAVEAAFRVFGKRGFWLAVFVIALIAVDGAVKDLFKIVEFAMTNVCYAAIVGGFIVPITFFVWSEMKRRCAAKAAADEN